MPEAKTITFSFKEVVSALIKQHNLHEGLWQIYFEFNLSAGNIKTDRDSLSPSAIVMVKKIGIIRTEEETSLCVDASKENPLKLKLKKPD